MAAASGYLLLAKAVTSAVSVVKADHVQGGACMKRDTEVFLWLLVLLLTPLFDKLICHLSTFGKMILHVAHLKSVVARVYLKKTSVFLVSAYGQVHEAFYEKYTGIFRTCVNSVYQASPQGWGGGGGGGRDLGTRLL